MKKIILITLSVFPLTVASAQEATPVSSSSPAPTVSNATRATAADVETLRQQVQSLTETVKALQQQVKDQQAVLEKANLTGETGLPANPEPSPIAGTESSPTPEASAQPRFPTEDTSVVTSATAPAVSGTPAPGGFPTTDTSVVTSAPETISSTGAGASSTAYTLGPTGCAVLARKLPGRCLYRGIRNQSLRRKTDAAARDFRSGILVTTECSSTV